MWSPRLFLAAVLLILMFVPIKAPGQGSLERIVLEEVARYDSESAGHDLTTIADAAFVGGGVITIEPEQQRICRFEIERRSTPAKCRGRRGRGPDESERLDWISLRGDSIWARDPRLSRFLIYSRDLEFHTIWTPDHRLFEHPASFWALEGNRMLIHRHVPSVEGLTRRAELVLLGPGARDARPVGVLSDERSTARVQMPHGGVLTISQYYADGDILSVDRGGRYIAVIRRAPAGDPRMARFGVTLLGALGDTLYSRRYSYSPLPLDAQSSAAAIDHFDAVAKQAQLDASGRRLLRDAIYLPEFHPPVSTAFVNGEGEVWLQTATRSQPTGSWLVLSREGTPLATASVPAGTLVDVHNAHAIAVAYDAYSLPTIIVYRIRRA